MINSVELNVIPKVLFMRTAENVLNPVRKDIQNTLFTTLDSARNPALFAWKGNSSTPITVALKNVMTP